MFFMTSADSGALVVDLLASSGADNSPIWQRIRYQTVMRSQPSGNAPTWQRRLRNIVMMPKRNDVLRFIDDVVLPAIHAVANELRQQNYEEERRFYRAEVFLREGGQDYDIMGWSREDVIGDVLDQYERHRQCLHIVHGYAAPENSTGAGET